MRKMRIFRGVAAIACVFAMTSIAAADTFNFDFDTTGDGAVFLENSGASIPYEIYLSIDDGGNGRDTQGITGYELRIDTDTGIAQPLPNHSDTSENTVYIYQTISAHAAGTAKNTYVGGFGFNLLNSLGAQAGDDIVGAGAFGGLEYRENPLGGANHVSSLAANIGYTTPSGEGFVPGYGDARSNWYLLRGNIDVPDGAGIYTVAITPTSLNAITLDTDLNNDDLNGYFDTVLADAVGHSFSFTVVPEPATMSALLLAGAGLVIRRRR